MSRESQARENWKAMLNMYGKKSKEELAAYHEYIRIRQGGGKKEKRAIVRTVPKQLFESEMLWQAVN
jgi:hypothetical protein